jgi:hypothetical protein
VSTSLTFQPLNSNSCANRIDPAIEACLNLSPENSSELADMFDHKRPKWPRPAVTSVMSRDSSLES